MSSPKSNLKSKTYMTLAWLAVFPFLAAWPFLSAFPLFSLINSTVFDITVTLNVLFLLSGFWVVSAVSLAYIAFLYPDVRVATRKNLSGKGLWIGAYATVWTGLYLIAAMASR